MILVKKSVVFAPSELSDIYSLSNLWEYLANRPCAWNMEFQIFSRTEEMMKRYKEEHPRVNWRMIEDQQIESDLVVTTFSDMEHNSVCGRSTRLNIDASISRGDSGAPVFNYRDGDSRFIGIALALQPGFNGVASISPLEYVIAFLNKEPAIACWEDPAFRERE